MTPPRPDSGPRKRASKSRTGCITCRIRRVKCDETHPNCERCVSTGRKCDGYLATNVAVSRRRLADLVLKTSTLGPASVTLAPILRQSPDPNTSQLDALFFNVFRNTTAPGTASLMPSMFWTRDLLQMAHGESAIWHATLSLGALHGHWEGGRRGATPSALLPSTHGTFKRGAYWHYFRAISLAKSITDPSTLLALSVVLVAISNFLGRWSDSRTHLFGGLRLLDRESSADVDSTAEILERLDLQAMTFSDSQAPYPFETPVWLRSLHRRQHGTETIRSYGHAATLILALMRQLILLEVAIVTTEGPPTASQLADMAQLEADLESWEAKMAAFESTAVLDEIPALSVRLFHAQLRVWLVASYEGEETRWDADECLFYFEYQVDIAAALIRKLNAQASVSLEPAVIAPLFSIIHRCRHPLLRRRALGLLRECKRQEGMWQSDGAAAVAETIVMTEEGIQKPDVHHGDTAPGWAGGATSVSFVPDIPWDAWSSPMPLVPRNVSWEGVEVLPESQRVKDIYVVVDTELRNVGVTMQFSDVLHPESVVTMDY
ncbi:uncharacterized protein DNG_08169 [Cephalotrichum gorgonifer]|uniref:Zn(2)-C6 fungal-type domain-containing protein n=1 Tax=Cephalotrichum gorgonifer TaxID=2041049 RepID=A0AAE8N3U4_9PEZI|nr:uncharacterized protein DNG_08169 [Cephalotrichum gorgonifer]